jgi:hypothetical protein
MPILREKYIDKSKGHLNNQDLHSLIIKYKILLACKDSLLRFIYSNRTLSSVWLLLG